jgi:hypothetical protein
MALLSAAKTLEALLNAVPLGQVREIKKDVATFEPSQGIQRSLRIGKATRGVNRLYWWIEAADERLDPFLAQRFGGVRALLEPPYDDTFEWPTAIRRVDPALIASLTTTGAEFMRSVDSRQSLVLTLLRDTVSNSGSSPARLVKALILARDLGDAELEKLVLEKLDRHGDEIDPSNGNSFRTIAEFWAAAYAKLVPVDLQDLAAKGKPLQNRRA